MSYRLYMRNNATAQSANSSVDALDDVGNERIITYVESCGLRYSTSSSQSQKSPFWAISCPRIFHHICLFPVMCRESDHPVFTSSDFATTVFFFTEQGRQPCVQPPTWRSRSLYLSPSDRVAQLYPQAPGSLFIAFYDSQG
jgi:hypothetical protein